MNFRILTIFISLFAALLAGFQAAGPVSTAGPLFPLTFEVFQTSKVLGIGKET
ncbi:hypothetical protein GYM62_06560 [Algoriphagus sp. NBT04N3]|uniref:hypothetical protein n=1 Tax=Algoriphagus sp. NBT04N3 TaxID=2705473 RepID=UPI001C62A087|nr:hypothetical protein [Algoriphagus sp. NBT04N3]QYH38477.1 hypothetical protein GYM62_06560 [Algoriphagus sp. NBT04N3]